ncbi:MAG: glutathione S-transferase family protein [Polyangiales bacterium]
MTANPKLKLYHYPATRSARVRWLLHELFDDRFELEVVKLYDGEQYSAAYLQKNPNHCVPALELTTADGQTMSMIESGAMVVLLADAYPEQGLAPPPAPLSAARADYLQVVHFAASWVDMMLWQIRLHEHLLASDEQDARTAARYRRKFRDEVEPQLIARLSRQRFACGDHFSAADCIVGHDVLWARAYGLCLDPVFERYVGGFFERPAFLQAMSDLGDFMLEIPAEKQSVRALFTG